MKTADAILAEASKTFLERNAVYKDNYLMVGRIFEVMFPNGLTLNGADDFNRFHIFMLKIVKQSRYVINWETGHQPSIHDDCVYSAMLEAIDAQTVDLRNLAQVPLFEPKESVTVVLENDVRKVGTIISRHSVMDGHVSRFIYEVCIGNIPGSRLVFPEQLHRGVPPASMHEDDDSERRGG